MEQPKQWLTETYEEELAYMYQQEEPLPDHQGQYYTSFYPCRSSNSPSFGGESLNELGQPYPALSPSANFLSFAAAEASTHNFSGGSYGGLQVQGTRQQLQAPARRGRATASTHEHVIAERKRREKLQRQFVSLATIVPAGVRKADKISLLGSAIDYVKQLEEKVKALGEQGLLKSPECTLFESKCSISAADKDDSAGPSGSGSSSGDSSPVDVEASTRGNTVLLKICCKERRGVLVMVLSELENQGLSIITTNVLPFTDSCLNITITAKASPLCQ
ncbi:transcription factor bHLH18-like [Triticum dicoccoides]|uniref:transcription factor bHLH18-like n=1 Tax=Triticum dicoccoides TaxID=85692 RepID=UPI00188EE7C3|nr:transcription factor bHLH18-like [Triticum dicoccoides]